MPAATAAALAPSSGDQIAGQEARLLSGLAM
jgi:hypothetical protein